MLRAFVPWAVDRGALSLTTKEKYQAPFRPLLPGVRVGRVNVVEEVDALVDENVCGVIIEPVQGEGGVHASSVEFLTALRKRCDEVGAVLIFDEIQVCHHLSLFLSSIRILESDD